jgi:hypothetical protein
MAFSVIVKARKENLQIHKKKFFNELKTTYMVSHNLQVRGKEYLSTQARKAYNSCFIQAEAK